MKNSNLRNMTALQNVTIAPILTKPSRSTANDFVMVYGMFLLIFGTLGNVLAVIVIMFYKSMRSTSRLLFITLASVDQGTLLFAEIRYWMIATLGSDLRHWNLLNCRAHTFLTISLFNISVWLMCLISLERVCLTFLPLKKHPFKTIRNVSILIALVIVLNIFKNVLFLSRDYRNGKCGGTLIGDLKSLVIADYVIGYGLPFLISLIATSMLLKKILQRKRQVTSSESSDTSNQHLRTSTVMLMAIVAVQIIMGTPGYVFSMMEDIGALSHLPGNLVRSIYTSLLTLTVTNNSINFYLYILCARGFRRTFFNLFRKKPFIVEGSASLTTKTHARSAVN